MTTFEVLEDSYIEKMYIDSFDHGWEGGLVIVFSKDYERGLLVLGYTELGEWIYHLQLGSKIFETDNYEPYKNRIDFLKKYHNIQ